MDDSYAKTSLSAIVTMSMIKKQAGITSNKRTAMRNAKRGINDMLEISYDLEQKTSYAKILADMCIQFDTYGEEDYNIGTPQCWDDMFLNRVNIDDYDVYHICYCLVRTGSYNSVTDYKKIWGLTGVSTGLFDGTYLTENGKVYFGISCGRGEKCFRSDASSIIILLPKRTPICMEDIFNLFKIKSCEFFDGSTDVALSTIAEWLKGSIVLRYVWSNEVSMTIFGHDAEKIFNQSDIRTWQMSDSGLVFRKGLL